MRVTTSITLAIDTYEVLDHEWYEYEGPIALCKGASQANSQRTQELGMQQKAFDTQQAQLKQLQTAFAPFLTGKQGFDPSAMSSMTSQFLNNNNATFNQAGQQVKSALASRGAGMGDLPVGGDYVRGLSGLMGAQASSQSQGLLGLNAQNAMQALTNQFNAGNLMSGNAATLTGTQGVAGSAASSALNSYITAKNSGLMSSLANGLGGALGQGLGAGISGGLGTVASGMGSGAMGW